MQEAIKKYHSDMVDLTESEKEELADIIKEFQEKLPTIKIVKSDDEILPKEESKHLCGQPLKAWWRK